MAEDITSNIDINTRQTGLDYASLATDYGTSGYNLLYTHVPLQKIAWGDETTSTRVTTAYPFPVRIYGQSTAIPVSGSLSASGYFPVRGVTGVPLVVIGSTFSADAKLGITGTIQGIVNGTPVGISGPVTISNSVAVYGVSGAVAMGITGGRRLNSSSDSVTVAGAVSISGISMSAATHSVAVYGSDLGNKVLARMYASDGTTLGMSGDAIKVALVNPGINFSVSYTATVGVTNASEGALRVQGYTAGGTPITIKGSLAGGAVEIGATSPVPVSVSGTVTIDDTDIVSSLENTNKPLIGALTTISSNTLAIQTISNQLTSTSGANVTIKEIKRASTILHGQTTATTTPTPITTGSIKTGVTIKALRANTGPVYIGNGGTLTTSNGYVLDAGDSVFLEVDDLKKVFIRTDTNIRAIVSYIAS